MTSKIECKGVTDCVVKGCLHRIKYESLSDALIKFAKHYQRVHQ